MDDNFLKDFNSVHFFKKRAKEIEKKNLLNELQNFLKDFNSKGRRKILSALWLQNFLKDFYSVYFAWKKMQKKLKIVQQITRRKELFAQWIPKLFKGF